MDFLEFNILDILDIILVAFLLFQLYKLTKGTVAIEYLSELQPYIYLEISRSTTNGAFE